MAKKLSKQPGAMASGSGGGGGNTANPGTDASTSHPSSSASSLTNAPGIGGGPLPPALTDGEPLPRLMVFDLDYTLWPFWIDTQLMPPMKPAAASGSPPHCAAVIDKVGESYAFYPDVPPMLHTLPLAGVSMAVASRTYAPDLAREMLKTLQIPPFPPAAAAAAAAASKNQSQNQQQKLPSREKPRRALDLFDGGLEIYPSSKVRHFEAIQRRTGVPYSEMIFFDDESRNKDVEQALGVLFCHVRSGMTWDELENGIRRWRRRRRAQAG